MKSPVYRVSRELSAMLSSFYIVAKYGLLSA